MVTFENPLKVFRVLGMSFHQNDPILFLGLVWEPHFPIALRGNLSCSIMIIPCKVYLGYVQLI
jgi:hypothetical protein